MQITNFLPSYGWGDYVAIIFLNNSTVFTERCDWTNEGHSADLCKGILIDSNLPITCWHPWSFIVVLTAPKTSKFNLIWFDYYCWTETITATIYWCSYVLHKDCKLKSLQHPWIWPNYELMLSFLQWYHTENDGMIWHANEASYPVCANNLDKAKPQRHVFALVIGSSTASQHNDDFYVGQRYHISSLSYHNFVLKCKECWYDTGLTLRASFSLP